MQKPWLIIGLAIFVISIVYINIPERALGEVNKPEKKIVRTDNEEESQPSFLKRFLQRNFINPPLIPKEIPLPQCGPNQILPGFFDRFQHEKTTHSWLNSYILSLLSDYSYAGSLGKDAKKWDSFKIRFQEKIRSWANPKMDLKFDFIEDEKTDTQVMIISNSKTVIVVFRGTEVYSGNYKDLETDFGKFELTSFNSNGVRVHSGYFSAMASVIKPLVEKLNVLMRKGQKLFITGHSLGGALATLTAIKIHLEQGIPIQGIYTFGSPPVGTRKFKELYDDALKPSTQRWANVNDVIVYIMPAGEFSFSLKDDVPFPHVGKLNLIPIKGGVILNSQVLSTDVKGGVIPSKKIRRNGEIEFWYFTQADGKKLVDKGRREDHSNYSESILQNLYTYYPDLKCKIPHPP